MAMRINSKTINQVLLGFFASFFVICALAGVYEVMWVLPEKHCLAEHHWWDGSSRICATPVDLRMFTGKPNTAPAVIGPGSKPIS